MADIDPQLILKALEQLTHYAYPYTNRGPADQKWNDTMQNVAAALNWPICKCCNGTGESYNSFFKSVGLCSACYGIGKCKEDEQ